MHFGKRFAEGQEAVVVRGRVNSRNRFGGLTGPQRFIGVMEAVFLETPPHDDVSAMLVDVRKL